MENDDTQRDVVHGIFDNNATCSLCTAQLLISSVLVEPCVIASCSHLHLQHDESTPTRSRSFGRCGHVHGAETGTAVTFAQLCCAGQGMRPGAAAVCRALSVGRQFLHNPVSCCPQMGEASTGVHWRTHHNGLEMAFQVVLQSLSVLLPLELTLGACQRIPLHQGAQRLLEPRASRNTSAPGNTSLSMY